MNKNTTGTPPSTNQGVLPTNPILASPHLSNSTISTSLNLGIELKDGPYDELGAKIFRIQALADGGLHPSEANALKPNTSYKFRIIGVLQEYVGNTWIAVNHKNTITPIKQTKILFFKTNSDAVDNGQPLNSGASHSSGSNSQTTNPLPVKHK